MITKLVTIGDSMVVKIPKALVEQYDLTKTDVQLVPEENGILISPVKKSRADWEEQFKKEIKHPPEKESDNIDAQNIFDETEWTW